ncbi:hypothetical protein HQ584_07395 [Patescibacteria group bacterium]|nr:hypothetical protein [Patescibacteria group bacterium]
MVTVKEQHLEWALKHLLKYSHSDFFPRMFEYSAISHNWPQVRKYILSQDLNDYVPKTASHYLAYKYNRTFRIVRQLEPIDSLIYTALIREVCEVIENYRIPESENIVCSYRIKPNLDGNFFPDENCWKTFTSKSEELSEKYKSGYVLICDITDFYNQINIHNIEGLITEASKGAFKKQAKIIHEFMLNLNPARGSRGIPVGPKPSIVLSELVMASVDNYIKTFATDFVRYVDDIRIFFSTYSEAVVALHNLTDFIHSAHLLVLSGEKSKILSTKRFRKESLRDEEREANDTVLAIANEQAQEKLDELFNDLPPYTEDIDWEEEYDKAFKEILKDEHFKLLSDTYSKLFSKSLETKASTDFSLLRYILIRARSYRIRSIIPLVLDNFERLLPLLREIVIYLYAVVNDEVVTRYKTEFEAVLSSYYMNLPLVNLWIARLLSKKCFNVIDLPNEYTKFLTIRSKSIIALRRQDTTWVRSFRGKMNDLGSWDKRAVMYASSVLPLNEMKPWISNIGTSDDIIEQSISSFLISKKKSSE